VTWTLWPAVVAIGGIGAVARFLVDRTVSGRIASSFPAGTFAVNISGATLLGLSAGVALRADAALLAGTAFVGAYTTFSTWMIETQRLAEQRQYGVAAANIALSVGFGLAAGYVGQRIGAHL
jgi:CrcB protein